MAGKLRGREGGREGGSRARMVGMIVEFELYQSISSMPVDFHAEVGLMSVLLFEGVDSQQADGVEAKILYNLFRSLFKIGNEIEMEMTRDKLYFKTFNEAKTIFCNTYFDSSFFKQFEASEDIETAISMFRGHASIESFRIDLDCSNSELIFNFRCRNGKCPQDIYSLLLHERANKGRALTHRAEANSSRAKQVCYSKQDCQNSIEFEASFHSNVEEISFITSSDDIHLKSSYDRPENGKTI
eukprot:764079-Hanusia_phi.AAC.8